MTRPIALPAVLALIITLTAGSRCLGGLASQPTARSGKKLTIATYNIQGGSDSDQILANLKKFKAQVICLQEVFDDRNRTGGKGGIRFFARQLGKHDNCNYSYIFAPYHRRSTLGCAILARGKLKLVKVLKMPGERNFGLIGQLTIDDQKMHVASIHLKSLPSPRVRGFFASMGRRGWQANTIVRFAKSAAGPMIVAGDCNTLPLTPAYTALASIMTDCCLAAKTRIQPTLRIGTLAYRIDHVFLKGVWKILSCNVPALDGSDHRPIVADLELLEPAGLRKW